MDTSLVPQRSLSSFDVPGALFSPTELAISQSTSAEEYHRIGRAISSLGDADELWECDYALWGMKKFGDEGLKLASTATRLSIGYLKVSARIAERFDPARRYANLTREHYRGLCCFPVDFTDKWLPTVAEKGFGARTLRALCVQAFGSDPKAGYSKNKKRSVSLPETLYARLKECSPVHKTAVFIEQILLDFVSTATSEQKARIAAALSTRDADIDKERIRRKAEKKPKVEKPEKIKEPAEVKPEPPRPTYTERREQQFAEGASPIPAKEGRPSGKKSRIKIVFFECRGLTHVENSDGMLRPLTKASASRFYSLKDAEAAAREYGEDRGYACEAFRCERCQVFHVRGKNFGDHVRPVVTAQ